MKRVPVTLQTTEIIGGVKRRPGDVVELDEADTIAVKTAVMERAAASAVKAKSNAGRD